MPRKSMTPEPASPPATDDRPERLAINLFDLQHLHPFIHGMLTERFDGRKESLIWVDRSRMDETAVPLLGPLLDTACLVDILRAEASKFGNECRAYLCRARAWVRLPASAVLTVVENGKPRLAEEWFPGAVESTPYQPPPPTRVVF